MFTNDSATCDHNKISIVVSQEEIQQFDIDLEKSVVTKVFDDIYLSEPIMVICEDCKLELKFEDIMIEKFIATPLLDKEQIDILSYITKPKIDESDGDECKHEKVSLELYQLVQLKLEKVSDTYNIKETSFGEKELYLTCETCSTILYEYFDAELENLNGEDELEDMDDSDIIIFDDEDDDDFDEENQ